jgi:GntR family transcriptional regulator, carbon starvation induced regulator
VKDKETGLTIATSVYDSIRRDILNGEIRPGDKLLFDALRERYSCGMSPLREALNRLYAEGWVAREEQRGFRAAETSETEMRQLVQTRILIEGAAIREAIKTTSVAAEENLVLAFHRLRKQHRLVNGIRSPEWERLHRAFHLALVAGSGLPKLIAFCMQLFDVAERYRILYAWKYPERNERHEHARILEAVLDGEADHAVDLLAAHYTVTLDLILAASAMSRPPSL